MKKAIQINEIGAVEMAQQLQAFTAFAEEPGSIPSAHKAANNYL